MPISFTPNSATIGTTEYSLPNNSTTLTPRTEQGVFQFVIDFASLASGDQYVVRIRERYDTAGSQRLIDEFIITGAQSKPLFVSPSFMLGSGWDCTVQKLAGTDRSIAWSIRRIY